MKQKYCMMERGSWVPVVHNCNPSYPGGRDQEDHSLKPAQDLVWKKTHHRKGLVEQPKVLSPKFKAQYHKNK
jgi:hypothetical protein